MHVSFEENIYTVFDLFPYLASFLIALISYNLLKGQISNFTSKITTMMELQFRLDPIL